MDDEMSYRTLSWFGDAGSVQVAGSWDHWSGKLDMTICGSLFHECSIPGMQKWIASVRIPSGPDRAEFKFIVDGVWTIATHYAVTADRNGNANNYISLPASLNDESALNQATSALKSSSGNRLHALPDLDVRGLRTVSFNVRYDNHSDGENSWSYRKQHVARTIQMLQGHVVGMQEVLYHMADQLHHTDGLLPGWAWVGQGRDGGKSGEMSPIFFDAGCLSVVATGSFWLSETPEQVGSKGWGADLPRLCTWAQLRMVERGKASSVGSNDEEPIKDSNLIETAVQNDADHNLRTVSTQTEGISDTGPTDVLVLNCHLDHKSEQAKVEGLRLIRQRARTLASMAPSVVGIVLTGDFNSDPYSTQYHEMHDRVPTPVSAGPKAQLSTVPVQNCKDVKEKQSDANTANGNDISMVDASVQVLGTCVDDGLVFTDTSRLALQQHNKEAGTITGFTHIGEDYKMTSTIDYIFTAPQDKSIVQLVGTLAENVKGKRASDHRAIFADIYFLSNRYGCR
eukprot:Clim_evm70s236 gene=Clim_evmTU70s236